MDKSDGKKSGGSSGRQGGNSGRKSSGRQGGNGDRRASGRQGGNYRKKSFSRGNAPIRKAAPRRTGTPGLIRLNKYIANAGICSRREADTYIAAGNVTVNGKTITEMGYKVQPTDEVRFDGRLLQRERKEYVLLNKPRNFITTTRDEKGRRTVMELISRASNARLVPVGRLDRNTTGLLLFTNDGELAKKLTHPKHGVRKIYHVELDKTFKSADLGKLREGLELEDGRIEVDEASYIDGASKKEVGVELHSGRNRIVRRIFEHLGYQVVKLDRVVLAGLTKKDLPRGHWRHLTEQEVINLRMIQ
ncbi:MULTISPECIES: pseudouridine synthase [Robiginitalea]|uniref:Pseudouridine synthase n=1 Tax=Robiginitalea biformata (strain ATCC BAA-864 / DSM 15991 / KCTC 12146 / HTCC2501) TaxID=313596 RepID=A4CJ52_ROBBH|nr:MULTISPECIES: pseudouridine synthase [Robiginitalea]EAR16960.1 ribosomal large subunit pseudouridine synthase B [Robiginitalea biformata HTCC2501]MDC6352836.1 pseudouridine synthase [Robiginitalea sp. PM2]MDC6373998.1 pseudouridine synthase [Robiginitalea sp. SP8]